MLTSARRHRRGGRTRRHDAAMRRASWFFRLGGVVVQRSASESAGASGAAVRRDQPTAVLGPPLGGLDHWNVGADLSVPGASHRSVPVSYTHLTLPTIYSV